MNYADALCRDFLLCLLHSLLLRLHVLHSLLEWLMAQNTVHLIHYDTTATLQSPEETKSPSSLPSTILVTADMAQGTLEPAQATEHVVELSPIDQIQPRGYIRVLFCFPLHASISIPSTSAALEQSLNATISRRPLFGGTVALARDGGEQNGLLEVRFCVPPKYNQLPGKLLGFDEFPYTYEDLNKAGMPLLPLDEVLLCSVPPVPQSDRPVPAVLAQANFISGGLILSICIHHAIADGRGAYLFIEAFADTLRPAGKSASVFTMDSSIHRKGLFHPCAAGPPDTHPAYKNASAVTASSNGTLTLGDASTITNRLFTFPTARLKDLKETVTSHLPDPQHEWVSTNDCLAALLWSTITRARLPNHATSETSSFALAVDVRARMSPPIRPSYAGSAVVHSIATADIPLICTAASYPSQLAKLALSIRKSLHAVDTNYISQTVSLTESFSDIRDFGFKIFPLLGTDLMLTSWRDFPYYNLTFGDLGKPQWVRKPWSRNAAAIVVLPWDRCADKEKGIEVVLLLTKDDMERLEQDQEFMKWVGRVVD